MNCLPWLTWGFSNLPVLSLTPSVSVKSSWRSTSTGEKQMGFDPRRFIHWLTVTARSHPYVFSLEEKQAICLYPAAVWSSSCEVNKRALSEGPLWSWEWDSHAVLTTVSLGVRWGEKKERAHQCLLKGRYERQRCIIIFPESCLLKSPEGQDSQKCPRAEDVSSSGLFWDIWAFVWGREQTSSPLHWFQHCLSAGTWPL